MVDPINRTGRNLTADSWFTDFSMVEHIRKTKFHLLIQQKNKQKSLNT